MGRIQQHIISSRTTIYSLIISYRRAQPDKRLLPGHALPGNFWVITRIYRLKNYLLITQRVIPGNYPENIYIFFTNFGF